MKIAADDVRTKGPMMLIKIECITRLLPFARICSYETYIIIQVTNGARIVTNVIDIIP